MNLNDSYPIFKFTLQIDQGSKPKEQFNNRSDLNESDLPKTYQAALRQRRWNGQITSLKK